MTPSNQAPVKKMSPDRMLRLVAGVVVLASAALTLWVTPVWIGIGLTTFVGANLLQSFFTDTCPALWLLRKLSSS